MNEGQLASLLADRRHGGSESAVLVFWLPEWIEVKEGQSVLEAMADWLERGRGRTCG